MRAIWFGSFITDTVYLAAAAWASRFVGSPLQQAMARRRYSALAGHYDSDVIPQDGYFAPLEAVLDRLTAAPSAALDVSTGTGAVIGAVLRRFPDCAGVAVDLSPSMLGQAVRNTQSHRQRPGFVAANAARLPFPADTFDLATVQNAFPVPRELVRVLRPGGWVSLTYSAGGPVLPWIVRSLVNQFRTLGCDSVETEQVGTGRYFLARKAPRGALS
jgi:ubiquinone/menaquinone biosynthesis C-methylase UbiE